MAYDLAQSHHCGARDPEKNHFAPTRSGQKLFSERRRDTQQFLRGQRGDESWLVIVARTRSARSELNHLRLEIVLNVFLY